MTAQAQLVGTRFHRLTVIKKIAGDAEGKSARARKMKWACACDCGGNAVATTSDLRTGNTKSCGCLQRERTSQANLRHGEWGTRLHKIWLLMRDRCNNPKSKSFPYYGGRGIKVCKKWDDFKLFRDWALSNGYSNSLEIERKKNWLGYSPGNCCWASRIQQMRNTRFNRILTFDGKKKTLAEWAEIVKIDGSLISSRLSRGWTTKKALTVDPKRPRSEWRQA